MTGYKIDCACSTCGVRLVFASIKHGTDSAPAPGDPIVCRKCGARLLFDASRRLRALTPSEFLAFAPDVRRAINAARLAAMKGDGEMKPDMTLLVACIALCSVVEVLPW